MPNSNSNAAPGLRINVTRDGSSALERAALERFRVCLPALPAQTLVQVALWPETVQNFARWVGIAPVHAYNTLTRANGRPYHANRAAYALRLGLTRADMDAAIERAPLPAEALPAWVRSWAWGTALSAADPPRPATGSFRDGSLALEQLALRRLEQNLAAVPKGLLLQLLHWPVSLKELAAALNVEEQKWYNLLSFQRGMRYPEIRERAYAAYAAHGVAAADFDHLIEAAPADPVALPEVAPPERPAGRKRRGSP